MGVTDCYVMNLTVLVHASPADAIFCNSDLAAQTTPSAAAAASGHCDTSGINPYIPIEQCHAENENHSHPTPIRLIPQSLSGNKGFVVNLETGKGV